LEQYTNVTVDSGKKWTVKAWNGTVGGILAFVASGTVTVTHKIDELTEYPEFVAAAHEHVYQNYKQSTHLSFFYYTSNYSSDSFRLPKDTWESLQTISTTNDDNVVQSFISQPRGDVAAFYSSISIHDRRLAVIQTDPFGLPGDIGDVLTSTSTIYDYDIDVNNYLENPQNLWYGIAGSQANDPEESVLIADGDFIPIASGSDNYYFVSKSVPYGTVPSDGAGYGSGGSSSKYKLSPNLSLSCLFVIPCA